MIAGSSETRWGHPIRRLVRDAIGWSDALAGRMGTEDPALRGRFAAEAVGLAACLIGERLRRDGASMEQIASVADQLRDAWQSAAARYGHSVSTGTTLPLLSNAADGAIASVQSLMAGGDRALVDQGQAALEFQRATGLGSEALVNDGHNLPALIFYHRVFLAARGHPAFTPAHRAQIVKAAQQCRERLERILSRVPDVRATTQPVLAAMASRQLRGGGT